MAALENELLERAVANEVPRLRCRSHVALGIGLIAGFCLAQLVMRSTPTILKSRLHAEHQENSWGSYGLHNQKENLKENSTIAEKLEKEVRVLCWVMTNPDNHKKKAMHVKRTWGKRCNKLLFMSTKEDPELNSIALPIGEGRNQLWRKAKEAFKYIHQHHLDDADWFLKADDDTFVIVENLRYLLYPYSPETPIYFGCKFKTLVKQVYMSGGAGYILSKEALRRLVEKALPDPKLCEADDAELEDVEMGKCLANVNVIAGDSRDSHSRGRFFPFYPEIHMFPVLTARTDPEYWYWKYVYYEAYEGLDCCSDTAISFHYIVPNQMHVLYYLFYQLRPYGIQNTPGPLPERLKVGETMPPPFDTPGNKTSAAL